MSLPKTVQPGKPKLPEAPIGWAQSPLGDHLTEVRRPAKLVDDDMYSLVTVKRARGGVVKRADMTGKEISVKSQFYLEPDDFLVSKRQIVHGACGVVPEELAGSIVSNEYSVFNCRETFDLDFLKYLSHSVYFQQTCFHSSIGVHVEKLIFKVDEWLKWNFNIPPLAEQKKIAKILTALDQAIEATESLVENAEAQKKALTQRLLTAQMRLPGFEEAPWETRRFDDLFKLEIGGTPSRNQPEYWDVEKTTSNRWVSIRDLKGKYVDDTKEYLSDEGADNCNAVLIPRGTVVMSFKLSIGKAAILAEPAYTNEAICALSIKEPDTLLRDFVFQALQVVNFEYEIDQAIKGKTLNKQKIRRLKMPVPGVEEQHKISSVLLAADKEIEVLSQQLDSLKKQKLALMQQLLTGKRRVKLDGGV